MGCCGDRRRQAAAGPSGASTTRVQSVTRPIARPVANEMVRLTYQGEAPVIVTGPRSGRLYRIETDTRDMAVDRRDVPAFLATGRFSTVDV